jgi:hypothetical protein
VGGQAGGRTGRWDRSVVFLGSGVKTEIKNLVGGLLLRVPRRGPVAQKYDWRGEETNVIVCPCGWHTLVLVGPPPPAGTRRW